MSNIKFRNIKPITFNDMAIVVQSAAPIGMYVMYKENTYIVTDFNTNVMGV